MDHQALAGVPLFAGMSDRELQDCAACFEQKRVLMGERLTTEDDYGYSFFLVLEGRVRVEIDDEAVVELGPGDHFGEVALVTGSKRNATVKALEACQLAKIMTWDFQELMTNNATLAARLQAVAEERS